MQSVDRAVCKKMPNSKEWEFAFEQIGKLFVEMPADYDKITVAFAMVRSLGWIFANADISASYVEHAVSDEMRKAKAKIQDDNRKRKHKPRYTADDELANMFFFF